MCPASAWRLPARWYRGFLRFASAFSLVLVTAQSRGAEVTVNGFLEKVGPGEIVAGSAPVAVERLARTKLLKDSLDLELMSRWGLNYLTGSVTVESNYASSYGNWPLKSPPFALGGDLTAIGDSEVRNALAFVLMRKMSGSDYGRVVQQGLMTRILSYQLPCGLFAPPAHADTDAIWSTAWMTRCLIEDFVTTGNGASLDRARRALAAVHRYAIETNAHGLLRLAPPAELRVDGQVIHFAYRPLDFCIVEPFVRYYEVTGDTNMLATARGLVDGRLAGFGNYDSGHTHSHWHTVIGVAHLAAVTGDPKYAEWVEGQLSKWSGMRTDYGWFEATSGYGSSETCAVSDLLHVCLYQARAGRTSHYDLVERTVRNYLPQEQFFPDDQTFAALANAQNYTDRARQIELVRRLQGGFFCRTTPSDRWAENTISLEGCCPPTGMTALYLAWKDILRKTDKGFFVNMAFNHDCAEASVVSFLPDHGRVTVVAKINGDFYVRVPGFAPRADTAAWRNGRKMKKPVWSADYIVFKSSRKGEELTVTYPLVQFDQQMKRAGTDYTIHWKGNEVTGLNPKGGIWPLFNEIPYPIPACP
jgi:hypothetical protein